MLFKHDDALILGWLAAGFFFSNSGGSYIGTNPDFPGGHWPNDEDEDETPSTGTGNFPRGEPGKPAYAGDKSSSLCGGGGSLVSGGAGAKDGLFGAGGNGYGYTSSGGGGGFYGGGSSYVYAGGGGGSSYFWDGDYSIKEGYMIDCLPYLEEKGYKDFNFLDIRNIGIDGFLIKDLFPEIYRAETKKDEWFSEGKIEIFHVSLAELYRVGMVGAFNQFSTIELPASYSSIMTIHDTITGKNRVITDGSTSNIKFPTKTIPFTLGIVEYEVPETGIYAIRCYGGQGGGSSYPDPYDPEVGGTGAITQGLFILEKGFKLYCLTGERGGNIRIPRRPQGGGGGAGTYKGHGGGGASTVFLQPNNMLSRLIVAGGGGGAGAPGGDDPNEWPPDGKPPKDPNPDSDNTKDPEAPKETDEQMFIISDLSIAYVDITYQASDEEKRVMGKKITVDLYVDGIKRGRITKPVKKGSNQERFTFDNFDQWLPVNTPPYWAKIKAVINTDARPLVIPPKGVIITVVTKKRPNDPLAQITKLFGMFKADLRLLSKLRMILKEAADLSDLRYLCSNIGFIDKNKNLVKSVNKNEIKIGSNIDFYSRVINRIHQEEESNLGELRYLYSSLAQNAINKEYVKQVQKTILKITSEIEFFNILINLISVQEESNLGELRYITSKMGMNSYEVNMVMVQKEEKQVIKSKEGMVTGLRIRIKTVTKNKVDIISKIETLATIDNTIKEES